MAMADIEFDLKGLRDLIAHPNREAIHAIYAKTQAGKTTFMLQIMYELSHKLERPVLIYDTEGGMHEFVNEWDSIHKAKYPKAKIDIMLGRRIDKILKDHGAHVVLSMSGDDKASKEAKEKTSGRFKLKTVQMARVSPMAALVSKKNYCAILYDSFTMPFKVFGPNQENFPARNHAQNLWLSELMNLIDEYGCSVWITNHATKNPTNVYAPEEMSGGAAIQYESKVILYLKKWEAKGATAYRSLKLMRYFSKPPNEHESLLKLTDDGFVDVEEDDMEADKEAAKKRK